MIMRVRECMLLFFHTKIKILTYSDNSKLHRGKEQQRKMDLFRITLKAIYKRSYEIVAEDIDTAIDEAGERMAEELPDIPDDVEFYDGEEIEAIYKGC